MASKKKAPRFLLCIRNEEYPASLEVRKVYRVLEDEKAQEHNMVRVVDESGEDYLYPAGCFVPIELPAAATKAIMQPS